MDVPLELSFENIGKSDSLEAHVRKKVERLDRLYDHLVACRVSIRQLHRHSRKGHYPDVRIEMSVPGDNIVVDHQPQRLEEKYAHPDAYDSVDEAFDAAERRLNEFKRRQRGDVKSHDGPPLVGVVAELDEENGFGFLDSAVGSQLWFHRNSVDGDGFAGLEVGDTVHYIEIVGATGPQAVHVQRATPTGRWT